MAMATAATDSLPVCGRVDAAGKLVAADARLAALQVAAGAALGGPLAIPQLAAIARVAAELGTIVSRSAVAATDDHDLELWVRATPDDSGVELQIERWVERPSAGPRLLSLVGANTGPESVDSPEISWTVDEELRIVALAPEFASLLEISAEAAVGEPLTRFLRLDEDEAGEMPLLAALAARKAFSGQAVRVRKDPSKGLVLGGEVVVGANGAFAGFQGSVESEGADRASGGGLSFEQILDEALRSPIDRIIEQAERITEQSDGPIRSDYAAYGNDIAAAARHLLSVVETMNQTPGVENTIDLAELAEEAVMMLETAAQERGISIQLQASRGLPANGDDRAVIQILVNLIGNAIRHSPEGGQVDLRFSRAQGMACLSVEDQGSGIAEGDEQRIFERFERASDDDSGTGLGLAISRRLARSMGGDVMLDPTHRSGARFTLKLPYAGNRV